MAKTATMKGNPKTEKKEGLFTRAKNYKKELDKAYDAGYKSGFADASKFKNSSSGARIAAKNGYGKALDNQNRIRKYTEKANK